MPLVQIQHFKNYNSVEPETILIPYERIINIEPYVAETSEAKMGISDRLSQNKHLVHSVLTLDQGAGKGHATYHMPQTLEEIAASQPDLIVLGSAPSLAGSPARGTRFEVAPGS